MNFFGRGRKTAATRSSVPTPIASLASAGASNNRTGTSAGNAAFQAVAGLISRTLASASVAADDGRFNPMITSRLLAWAGRKMLLEGQAAILFDGTKLIPAGYHSFVTEDVIELLIYNPDDNPTIRASVDQVALPWWEVDEVRFYQGTSPFARPLNEVGTANNIGAMLRREASSSHGYIAYAEEDAPGGGLGETEAERTREAVEASVYMGGQGDLGVITGSPQGITTGPSSDSRKGTNIPLRFSSAERSHSSLDVIVLYVPSRGRS